MISRELTCINCPLGCIMQVQLQDEGLKKISGNSCKKGEQYAVSECTNPLRIVTTSIPVTGSSLKMLSVKTAEAIPKSKIKACIETLKNIKITAPVKIGDIIIEDVAGTGVNIVATRKA